MQRAKYLKKNKTSQLSPKFQTTPPRCCQRLPPEVLLRRPRPQLEQLFVVRRGVDVQAAPEPASAPVEKAVLGGAQERRPSGGHQPRMVSWWVSGAFCAWWFCWFLDSVYWKVDRRWLPVKEKLIKARDRRKNREVTFPNPVWRPKWNQGKGR